MVLNGIDESYDTLHSKFKDRIEYLKNLPKIDEKRPIEDVIKESGFDRRDFLKWAGAITAMLSPLNIYPTNGRCN